MSDFAPSIEAAKSALGSATPITTNPHPVGAAGAKASLDEVALRVKKGRLDPRVRAWAIRSIKEAGEPRSVQGQGQALLDALRKATTYVQDPVSAEFMQAAHETLCLDDHGLCFMGGDCDDLCIAYGSAAASIGIQVKIVGQSFDQTGVPTHVIVAIHDAKASRWLRVDPSSKYPVGQYFPATKEIWIDPMDGSAEGDAGVGGEFVGVGSVPQLGDILDPAVKARFNGAINSVQSFVFSLQKSLIGLQTAKDQADQTCMALRPNNPFDPEPGFAINDVSQFLTGGMWTKSMSDVCTQLLSTGNTILGYFQDGLNGARRITVDPNTHEAGVEAKDSDPWQLRTVVQTATDSIIAFVEKPQSTSAELMAAAVVMLGPLGPLALATYTFTDGFTYLFSYVGQQVDVRRIMGGFSSRSGASYTPQQIQAQAQATQSGAPGSLGQEPISTTAVVVIGVVAVAVLLASAYAIKRICDYAEVAAREATSQKVLDLVAQKLLTPEQAQTMLTGISAARVAEAKAQAEVNKTDPFSNALGSIGQIVEWLVIGGVIVTVVVIGAPIIKEGVSELTAWAKARRESMKDARRGLPEGPTAPPALPPDLVPATGEALLYETATYPNPRRRRRARRRA